MLKYAKIINEETKECAVGVGTNSAFYQSIGFEETDVARAYDGKWYLAEFVPEKPDAVQAAEVRAVRNQYLNETDKYMISDFPISEAERLQYQAYRRYLRDITKEENFPNVEVFSFATWVETTAVNEAAVTEQAPANEEDISSSETEREDV